MMPRTRLLLRSFPLLVLTLPARGADLALQLDTGSDCVQPGENVTVTLSMSNLAGSGLDNEGEQLTHGEIANSR